MMPLLLFLHGKYARLKDAQIHLLRQLFQHLDPRQTISLGVQSRSVYSNSHPSGYDGHDTAAHAAFRRNAHIDRKIS